MTISSEYNDGSVPMFIPGGQRFLLKEEMWYEEHYKYRHGVLQGLTHLQARSGEWRNIVTEQDRLDRIREKWLDWCGMRGIEAYFELPADISCLDVDLKWYREHTGIGRTCVDSPLPRRYAVFWDLVIEVANCVSVRQDARTKQTVLLTYCYPKNYGIIRQWCSDCRKMGVRYLHLLSEYNLTFCRRTL